MQIINIIGIATALLSYSLVQTTTIMLDSIAAPNLEQRIVLQQQEAITTKKIINGITQQLPTRWHVQSCMDTSKTADEKRSLLNNGNTSLYLTIGCYQAPRLTITLIRYENEPQSFHATKGLFIPQLNAHKMVKKNVTLIELLRHELELNAQHQYYVIQPSLIAPIKQLMGLTIPALFIDIGLNTEQDIPCVVQVLSDALTHTIINLYEK